MPAACETGAQTLAQRSQNAYPVQYDIPYFAHQQLDPSHFPYEVGMPIGNPEEISLPSGGFNDVNGDWMDDETENEDQISPGEVYTAKRNRRLSYPGPINSAAYKKMKMNGGRPAIAKKVTAELDSDDELLVRMKNAKYLEKEIAQRLQDEGRISYNPKTIGTRWARLQKALQKQQDEMLDAELSDWHEGDDDVLGKAVEKARADVEKLKAAAEAKMWRIVADEMKAMKPVTNFSQNACRNRYEALEHGAAKIPPELTKIVTEKTMASVQRRKDREAKIKADQQAGAFGSFETENIEKNAWTSRMKKYF